MKIFQLKKNPLNIQKCLLPVCEFLKENYGRYCIVIQNNCKVIVKIGLCEVKHINDCLFLDSSVSIFPRVEKASTPNCQNDITFDDFIAIGKPKIAKIVEVTIVFVDFSDVKKYRSFEDIVRDVLKLFVFSDRTVVRLSNLSLIQKFGMHCIIVEEVNGSRANEIFRVDSSTQIKIGKCISRLKFDQLQETADIVQVGGYSRIYSILKETFEFSKCFDSNHIKFVNKLLLIGPAGCGKSLLVHTVARECKCILLEVSPSSINVLSAVDTEQKLKSVFQEAQMYSEYKECCVILIEDIDMMSSGKTLHAKRFTGQLITLLEDIDNTPGLVVVATTNSPDEIDPQLRRPKRLEDELEMMVPTMEERMEILEKISRQCGVKIGMNLLQQISAWTPGFVGADIRLLVVEALMICKRKGFETLETENQIKDCFKEAVTKVIPSALRGAVGLCTSNNITFSQIGGLEDVKKILDLCVKQQLENPEKFRKFGIPLTKGILLYGPPGCAKTTLVKALAKECNTTFLATSATDLYSPFVGDAEKKIVFLFTQARLGSPSILFFDEIDAVVGSKSGDRERGVQERILSTLLVEMDGVGLKVNTQRDNSLNLLGEEEVGRSKEMNSSVVVIGATNRPQMVDDALKRPGRFDRLLYVPPPDESERYRILNKLTEKMRLHEAVDLNRLAKMTNFYSGADLKNLCQEAGLHALNSTNMTADCVRQSDFEFVISKYKPSLNEKVVAFYESFQKYNI